jgi:adenine phosphoribosyltransferase
MLTTMPTSGNRLKSLIRTIPDFPKPGIQFRDITTLLQDPWGWKQTVDSLVNRYRSRGIQKVVAIESRGFTLGGALAMRLGSGLVLARKKGKLPGKVIRQEYALEYGHDCIEIHSDSIRPGESCLVIDDLLATGGTCQAACTLVERMGGRIASCAFVVALPDLKGPQRLARYDLHWLVEFEGD